MTLRRIAHLDMDAFYASVELLRYPQLKGLPVVIGGGKNAMDGQRLSQYAGRLHEAPLSAFSKLKDYTGRGVITTATYEARAYGVGSALGIMKAAKLCPEAILLPVTFEEYRAASKAFKTAVRALAPHLQDRGVDEIYLDLSAQLSACTDGGRALAAQLQGAVFAATGLTCSIGIAPNKLLAKMASEFNKPRGISIVYETDVATLIWPLPVRKINGIGPKTEARLQADGIISIGDLAQQAPYRLIEHYGKSYGAWLHAAANGLDDSAVSTESEPVSMSRETTFDRDLHAVHNRSELGQVFTDLCEQVAKDLQRKGYLGKTIGIKVKYPDYSTVTRDLTVPAATQDAKAIRRAAGLCLKRLDLTRRFRLLGVRVGHLVSEAALQASDLALEAATATLPHTDDMFPE